MAFNMEQKNQKSLQQKKMLALELSNAYFKFLYRPYPRYSPTGTRTHVHTLTQSTWPDILHAPS